MLFPLHLASNMALTRTKGLFCAEFCKSRPWNAMIKAKPFSPAGLKGKGAACIMTSSEEPRLSQSACFALAWSLSLAQDGGFATAAAEWLGDAALRTGSDAFAATASLEEVEQLKKAVELAQLAYEDFQMLNSKLPGGLTLRAAGRERAVWFMAEEAQTRTVFLVFRGTLDWRDMLANMQVAPDLSGKHRVHGGFAAHVSGEANPKLERELAELAALPRNVELHVLGHSLGGAMALALLASGRLQELQTQVTMIGSPKVFHEVAPSVNELGAKKVTLLVNHGDVVPRLLGDQKIDISHQLKQLKQLEIRDEDMPPLAHYKHPAGLELVVLRGAMALKPSPIFHDEIWLDPTALSGMKRDPVTDHLMAEYSQSLHSLDPSAFGRSGLLQNLRDWSAVMFADGAPAGQSSGPGCE